MTNLRNRIIKCFNVALHVACTVFVYRRGNELPLLIINGNCIEHDDKQCADGAVRYGKALADSIKGLMR